MHPRCKTLPAHPRLAKNADFPYCPRILLPRHRAVRRCSSGVEQRIRNAWVVGSIPINGTIILSLLVLPRT